MDLLALFATLYVVGVVASFIWMVQQRPADAEASSGGVTVRAAILSILWPGTLAVGILATMVPSIGNWIITGRMDG